MGKIAVALFAMAIVRNIVSGHGHGDGESRRSRRRRMIVELHRELHADHAVPPEGTPKS